MNNMDQRMLDLGGLDARRRLMAMVKKNNTESVEEGGVAASNQEYNAEEAKVQQFGDTGQGNRLTDAKKAAQLQRRKWKSTYEENSKQDTT